MNKVAISLFFLFLSILIIPSVYAAGSFEVSDVPSYLDEQLGCGEFVGGLIASVVLLCIVMLPTMYLTKGKAYSLYIIFGLLVLAPLVGLGWLPVWLYIIIILLIALGFGKQLAVFFGGIGK